MSSEKWQPIYFGINVFMALYSTEAPFDTQPVKVFEVRWCTIACHELSSMRLGDAYNRQWTGSLRMTLFIIFNS